VLDDPRVRSRLIPVLAGGVTALLGTGIVLTHRAGLSAGLALVVASVYLLRRRAGALWATVALLGYVSVRDVRVEHEPWEALLAMAAMAVLLANREAFCVRLAPRDSQRAAWLAAQTGAAALAAGAVVLAVARPDAPLGGLPGAFRDDLALLSMTSSPFGVATTAAWVPVVLGVVGALAFLRIAWLLCRRPVPAPTGVPLEHVARLVRAHGTDTLSAFKLRADLEHLTSPCGEAVVSYRVASGVLLVAGDPLGPPDTHGALLTSARLHAAGHGLRLGVLGASEELAGAARAMGLRSLYVGDEAVVDTAGFALEGRRVKKLRQAVGRVERHGYAVELRHHETLTPAELDELEALSERARTGAPERGFSMALESLRGEHLAGSWVVVAREAGGAARAFLHFTPTHGRPAASLGFMRRDRDTPNGLIDFLVVRAIEGLRAEGIEELSLNFAAFGRYLRAPASRAERVAGRVATALDRVLQIESLYRFNRKFGPRWVPRYLVYESRMSLARTGIAAMRVEGQLGAVLPAALAARGRG